MPTLKEIQQTCKSVINLNDDHYILFTEENDAREFMSKFAHRGTVCMDMEAVEYTEGICVRAVRVKDHDTLQQYADETNGAITTDVPELIVEAIPNSNTIRVKTKLRLAKQIAQRNGERQIRQAEIQDIKDRQNLKKVTRVEQLQQIVNGEDIDFFGINQSQAKEFLKLYDSLSESNKHQMEVLLASKDGLEKLYEFNQSLKA